jgi:hypothetical protein
MGFLRKKEAVSASFFCVFEGGKGHNFSTVSI